MKTLHLILVGSLVVNVVLFAWSPSGSLRPSPTPRVDSENAADADRMKPASTDVPVTAFETPDVTVLRDALRSAGASESITRAVLEGVLRQRHREQVTAQRIDLTTNHWWRSTASGDENRLLREQVTNPLRTLCGRDPHDLADAENRYPFLPPQKRRQLAAIDLDYVELESAMSVRSLDRLKSEHDQEALLANERRKDILNALSPDERAEYEMRFEGTAMTVSRRFATLPGSEAAYRLVKPQLDGLNVAEKDLPRDANFSQAYNRLQQDTMDRLVAALGYDNALNYIWSGPGLYPALVRGLQNIGFAPRTAGEILQLAALSGEQAAAIHADSSRSLEQKRAALAELQQSARVQLDRLVPEALRIQLPDRGVSWLGLLGEGSYKGFHPTLLSSGLTEIAPTALTTKAYPRTTSPPALPRRPGATAP